MFLKELKNIKSGRKDLRNFGLVIGFFLVILGLIALWRGRFNIYLFGIGIFFVLLGLIFPNILKPFQKVWMAMALVLGWIMTRVILIVAFYVIFGIVGLLAKIFGKCFLELGFDSAAKTYWHKRNKTPSTKEELENQF